MILAGAQDAGPLRYLLALNDFLQVPVHWLASSITAPIIAQHGQTCHCDWDNTQASLLLTGTALGQSLDKTLVQWARDHGIPSVSVIEHWSWYRKRFELDGKLLLPDHIIVNDEIAKEQALSEGLPEDRLFIGGNPWLETLSLYDVPAFDKLAWREKCQLPSGRLVVFISESLRDDFPHGSKDYLGYDEYIALDGLRAALPADARLVIKRHPEESPEKYLDLMCSGCAFQLDQIPVSELAQGADAIVGMASMLLIELAMFRDDVISFRPNARLPFMGETIGATTPAGDVSTLANLLKPTFKGSGQSFRSRFNGSGVRIANFLKGVMQ